MLSLSQKQIPVISLLTVPLILGCFVLGLYFKGTVSILVFPHLAGVLAFLAISVWPGFREGLRWPGSVVLTGMFLFYLCVWQSIFWSTNPYNSTLFAMILSVLPVMFLSLILAKDPRRWLFIHLSALAVGIAVLALWAWVQFFILNVGKRVHDPMLNPNNLSVVFNMAIFPAMALFFSSRRLWTSVAGFVLAVLYTSALFMTQSRGGLIAFVIALVVFFMMVRGQEGLTVRKTLLFLLSVIACFLMVHLTSSGFYGKTFTQLVDFLSGNQNQIVERTLIWASTWKIIQEHFWTGTGLGTFIFYYPKFRSPHDASDGFFAHMDPLQFWAEMGVFAYVLFYAWLITVFVRHILATRASAPSSQERLWMYGFFCGLLVLAGHSHISFHLYMPVILFLAAFLLAGWFIFSEEILKDERVDLPVPGQRAGAIARIGFVVLLLVPVVWMGRAAAGVYWVNKVPVMMRDGDVEQAGQTLELAGRIAPDAYSPFYDYQSRYYLFLMNKSKADKTIGERRVFYHKALESVDRAIALNSGFAELKNKKALIYFQAYPDLDPQGRDKAQALLEQALVNYPFSMDMRIGLMHIYRQKGETDKALAVLKEGQQYPLFWRGAIVEFYKKMLRDQRVKAGRP